MKRLFLTISIAFVVTLCVMVSACRAYRPAAVNTTTIDTVTYREVLRDTVVMTEPDSALVRALIECDSLGQAHIKRLLDWQDGRDSALHLPKFYIDGNVLHVKSYMDGLAELFTLKDTFTSINATKTITVEVNRLTWWQKLWIGVGKAWGIGGVLVLIIKFLKRY